MKTQNKISLVTGSASGMGRETALLFAKNGYTVVCTDKDKKNLYDTVSMIKNDGGSAYEIIADITKVDDIKNLAKELERKYEKLDVLINCAGLLGGLHNLVDFSEEDMDLILDVNLKGTYRCCKYLLPLMIRQSKGIIINISSQSGKIGEPTASIYAAAKWAVIGFTKSLDLEVRKHNIKVVVINPGTTKSHFHDKREVKFNSKLFNKFLRPADIAKACLFVAEQSENCIIKEMDLIPMSETTKVVLK
jgi:NADP-dependent 3-hydroxy acid dehydrogenase YdfG